jgi:hypothetical protein
MKFRSMPRVILCDFSMVRHSHYQTPFARKTVKNRNLFQCYLDRPLAQRARLERNHTLGLTTLAVRRLIQTFQTQQHVK